MNLLLGLDFGDDLTLAVVLLVLFSLMATRSRHPPITPETRTFLFDFVKNNTGIAWAFLVILVFLGATLHILHDPKDSASTPILETFKTLLAGAAGWMGNMLQGRLARATDGHTDLTQGIAGTQDTVVTTHKETSVTSPVPTVLDPAAPIVVQKIQEPVTVKQEDGPATSKSDGGI